MCFMKTDYVFAKLSEESIALLGISREIFDKKVEKLIEDERQNNADLYDVLFRRAGITDPFLRGRNRQQQAIESGEDAIKWQQAIFDIEVRKLKKEFEDRNRAITWWALTKELESGESPPSHQEPSEPPPSASPRQSSDQECDGK